MAMPRKPGRPPGSPNRPKAAVRTSPKVGPLGADGGGTRRLSGFITEGPSISRPEIGDTAKIPVIIQRLIAVAGIELRGGCRKVEVIETVGGDLTVDELIGKAVDRWGDEHPVVSDIVLTMRRAIEFVGF